MRRWWYRTSSAMIAVTVAAVTMATVTVGCERRGLAFKRHLRQQHWVSVAVGGAGLVLEQWLWRR